MISYRKLELFDFNMQTSLKVTVIFEGKSARVAQIKALGAFCKRIVLYCTVSLQNSRERLEIGRYCESSRFSPKITVTFRQAVMRLFVVEFPLLVLLVLTPWDSEAVPLGKVEPSLKQLQKSAPRARAIGGTISSITGLGTVSVAMFLLSTKRPLDEGLVALAAFTLGSVNVYDGFSRLTGKSSAEFTLPHYKLFGSGNPSEYGGVLNKNQYAILSLERLAQEARHARRWRGVLDLLSATTFFFYFGRGERSANDSMGDALYPYAVYPAALLSGIGFFRLLFPSAEERAWGMALTGPDSAVNGPDSNVDWSLVLFPGKSLATIIYSF